MSKYVINNDLTIRNIADETFIMNRDMGIVHSFNETGIFIWNEITSGKTFDEIVTNTKAHFDESDENTEEDIFQFIVKLEDSGLITVVQE